MELLAAITGIRHNISEPTESNSRFTNLEIIAQLNRAVKEVAREINYPTRISSLTSVAQQKEYTLPTYTIEVLGVTYDSKPLLKCSWDGAQSILNTGTNTTLYNIPDFWYFIHSLTLGLVPIPSESSKTIYVRNIYAKTDIAADTDTLPYDNEDYNELIILKSTAKLLIPNFKEESSFFIGQYNEKIIPIKIEVKNIEGDNLPRAYDTD